LLHAYRPGRGYVHPAEAADEILDEALQPFRDDLQRRVGLGMRSAAVELAAGVLLGLYNCRHGNSETLLEYSPDYAADASTLQYRQACMHENPWLRLLRREVEALARTRHGDRYVSEQQARAELTRVNHEIRRLRTELAELEERRAKLSSDLGE